MVNGTFATPAQPGIRDYALLLALAACWGTSFLFIKIAAETVPAITVTAARLVIALPILMAATRMAGQVLPRGLRLWGAICAAALFGAALPFTLITWGEERIDSGLAAILMAVMPLTTVLLAHFFTRDERLTPRKTAGVVVGIAGLVVLFGPEKLAQLGADTVRQLAVAAAAVCYGVNAVITKRLIGQPRQGLAAAMTLAAVAMMVPASLIVDRPWRVQADMGSIAAILVLGVVQTAIGTMIMFALIHRQGASFFSQINFLVPLVGVIAGALILFERPPPNAYVALVLILLGVAVARGRAAAALKPP